MKEKALYCVWAILYALCAALGFLGETQGVGRVFLVLAAVIFFLPGAALVVIGLREKNKKVLRIVRITAIVSLCLTLIALVANMAAVNGSELLGNMLHVVLVLVSTPMICGQYWILSLFLWACLLFATFLKPKKEA